MSMILPDEMTPAIKDALGIMCFQSGPIANFLRSEGKDIPRKVEAEQAEVLFWFLKRAIEHGDKWREVVAAEMDAISKRTTKEATDDRNNSRS